jgi:methylmalonyl-CoA mutase N-terminal domain/subunit
MGGPVGAIEKGFMQRAVAESAYEYQRKLETGQELVVGVNAFTGEQEIEVLPNRMVPYPYDPNKRAKAEDRQIERLNEVRKKRDNGQVQKTLKALEEASRDEKVNVMPATLDAVKAYASIGEICGVLRKTLGEYSGFGSI